MVGWLINWSNGYTGAAEPAALGGDSGVCEEATEEEDQAERQRDAGAGCQVGVGGWPETKPTFD